LFGRGFVHNTFSFEEGLLFTHSFLSRGRSLLHCFTTANSPPYPSAIYSKTRPEYIYNVPYRHKPAGE
jgi:hypothetical protein